MNQSISSATVSTTALSTSATTVAQISDKITVPPTLVKKDDVSFLPIQHQRRHSVEKQSESKKEESIRHRSPYSSPSSYTSDRQ